MTVVRHGFCVLGMCALVACGGGGSSTGSSSGGTAANGGATSVQPSANAIAVTGRVVDAGTNAGIAGASVSWLVRPQPVSGSSGTASSASDGTFAFTGDPDSLVAPTASLTVRATGYYDTTLTNAPISPSNGQLETILMVKAGTSSGSISGVVRNARTGAGIPNASIYLAEGQTTAALAISSPTQSSPSNAQGAFSFAGVNPGTYTLVASAVGFENGRRTAVPVQSAAVSADIVMSPSTGSGDIRIVLTWGATPSDLDAHLTGPNADSTRFHIYYANKGNLTAAPFAALDIDNTHSFGPETITIPSGNLNSGVYRYSVHDFTDKNVANSAALGASGAKVDLYLPNGSAPQTFFVPNQSGTLWTVFELTATRGQTIVTANPVNTMGVSTDSASILFEQPREASAGSDAAGIDLATRSTSKQ